MKLFIFSEVLKPKNIDLVITFINDVVSQEIDLYIYEAFQKELEPFQDRLPNYKLLSNKEDFKAIMPDYVVTMGGDGTILNAVKVIEGTNVPIIGVNMGRLGFLSSVEKNKMPDILTALKSGNIHLEKRTLLNVVSNIPIFTDAPYALNDFTLHKRDTSSMVTIHVSVNDNFLNSYWADGIIVSTPTGSTGYSLACGGPIVFPESGNFVITPVAPHNLNVRPLIISDTAKITMQIEGRSENFLCTMDSRYQTVTQDHIITIQRNSFDIVLATLDDINFMKTIRNKLMWGLDKRN